MLLFRSEEHIDRWCEMWGQPRGGTLSLDQGWKLATAWYGQDRRVQPVTQAAWLAGERLAYEAQLLQRHYVDPRLSKAGYTHPPPSALSDFLQRLVYHAEELASGETLDSISHHMRCV